MNALCPGCRAPVHGTPACTACRLPLTGPIAKALWDVDQELDSIERRRGPLLARRHDLLTQLRLAAAPPLHHPAPQESPRDMSPKAVQNLLLILGGALLTVAATVFTVVNWGSIGLLGRSAILLAMTAIAMSAPALLLRQRLAATAETVGLLGLAMFLLDGYAAFRAGLFQGDPVLYTGVLLAAAAGLWALYSRLIPLRLTRPAAVILAQFPLPLISLAAPVGRLFEPVTIEVLFAQSLVATAALNFVIYRLVKRPFVVILFAVTGILGSVTALGISLVTPQAAVVLFTAAALAAWCALAETSRTATAAGAVLLIAALATPVRESLPTAWYGCAYALAAIVVLGLSVLLPLRLRTAGAFAATGMAALAAASAVPSAVVAFVGPIVFAGLPWTGETDLPGGSIATPITTALLAVGLLACARITGRMVLAPGIVAGGVTLMMLLAGGPPYEAVVAVLTGVTVALMASGARRTGSPVSLAWAVPATSALLWALPEQNATLAVVGVLGVAAAGCAVWGKSSLLGASAVALAAGEAVAVALAMDRPVAWAGLAVIGVAAGIVPLGVRSAAVEVAGYAAGVLGLALTAGDPDLFNIGLATAGILGLLTALRKDRRPAWYAGGGLLLLALWHRLFLAGVDIVEAYTVPLALAALLAGWLRRRREGDLPSWTAYGLGLAVALIPSTIAVVAESSGPAGWIRPLSLGVAALAITLAVARFRLQAPTVLGAITLIVVGLNELMPGITHLLSLVPRWIPLAFAGLLLLAIGTTYERRLRDLRRLRAAVSRLG